MKLSGRIQFVIHNPAFKKAPVLVSCRTLAWLLIKKLGIPQTIKIHTSSRMRLYPLKNGFGAPGLFYTFRENFEETISHCIHRFVKDGTQCFDIGTNIGMWTLLMSENCGSTGHVYSFEPIPSTLKNLRENIELSKKTNITVLPTALGDKKGTLKMYVPPDPGRASLARETSGDSVEEVSINKLDDIWQELGFPKISFVKMDVEGAEPLVLEGGSHFFQQCRPVVTSEINATKLSNIGKKPEDIFKFFRNWDYEAFILETGNSKLVRIDHCDGGDAVFIPKEPGKA